MEQLQKMPSGYIPRTPVLLQERPQFQSGQDILDGFLVEMARVNGVNGRDVFKREFPLFGEYQLNTKELHKWISAKNIDLTYKLEAELNIAIAKCTKADYLRILAQVGSVPEQKQFYRPNHYSDDCRYFSNHVSNSSKPTESFEVYNPNLEDVNLNFIELLGPRTSKQVKSPMAKFIYDKFMGVLRNVSENKLVDYPFMRMADGSKVSFKKSSDQLIISISKDADNSVALAISPSGLMNLADVYVKRANSANACADGSWRSLGGDLIELCGMLQLLEAVKCDSLDMTVTEFVSTMYEVITNSLSSLDGDSDDVALINPMVYKSNAFCKIVRDGENQISVRKTLAENGGCSGGYAKSASFIVEDHSIVVEGVSENNHDGSNVKLENTKKFAVKLFNNGTYEWLSKDKTFRYNFGGHNEAKQEKAVLTQGQKISELSSELQQIFLNLADSIFGVYFLSNKEGTYRQMPDGQLQKYVESKGWVGLKEEDYLPFIFKIRSQAPAASIDSFDQANNCYRIRIANKLITIKDSGLNKLIGEYMRISRKYTNNISSGKYGANTRGYTFTHIASAEMLGAILSGDTPLSITTVLPEPLHILK